MVEYAIVPVISAPELTGSDLGVWAALCRHAQWEMKDGKPIKSKAETCFPSKEEIVKTSRYSVRTVYNSLAHLEALGYISRSHRRRSGNFISTGYQLFSEGERLKHNTPSAIFADGNICHRQYLPTGPAIFADDHRQYLPTNNIKINNIIEQEKEDILLNTGNYKNNVDDAGTKPAAAEAPDRVSLNQVTKLWNDRLSPLGFPAVMKETPSRQRAFKARLNEAPERQTLEWWQGLISRIECADFLTQSAREKAGWLNFDWFLNENNLVKVLEGRYDGKREEPRVRGRPREEYIPMTYEEAAAMYRGQGNFGAIDVEVTEDDTRTGLRAIC